MLRAGGNQQGRGLIQSGASGDFGQALAVGGFALDMRGNGACAAAASAWALASAPMATPSARTKRTSAPAKEAEHGLQVASWCSMAWPVSLVEYTPPRLDAI